MTFTLTLRDGETLVFDDIATAGIFAISAAGAAAATHIAANPDDEAAIVLDRDAYIAAVQAILSDAELTATEKVTALAALVY